MGVKKRAQGCGYKDEMYVLGLLAQKCVSSAILYTRIDIYTQIDRHVGRQADIQTGREADKQTIPLTLVSPHLFSTRVLKDETLASAILYSGWHMSNAKELIERLNLVLVKS